MPLARPLLPALLALALFAPAAAAQDLDLPVDTPAAVTPSIEVLGEASLTARNDAARVIFGMEARRPTGPAALRVSARRARRVIARLRELGIENADMRTLTVRLTRFHRRGQLRYALARNSVRVTIREVRRVGALIDAGVAAGATDVSAPSFFVSNPKALYRLALLAAFDDARAKAELLAERADVLLGAPLKIREGATTSFDGGGGEQRAETLSPTTPTRPGSSRIDASVLVEFSLEEF